LILLLHENKKSNSTTATSFAAFSAKARQLLSLSTAHTDEAKCIGDEKIQPIRLHCDNATWPNVDFVASIRSFRSPVKIVGGITESFR